METKTFEIRDRVTFIPAVAVKLSPGNWDDEYLLRRAGFGDCSRTFVILTRLEGGKAHHDPFEWMDRTFTVAHSHIERNWESLPSGSVVDVEYILGESSAPKESESVSAW